MSVRALLIAILDAAYFGTATRRVKRFTSAKLGSLQASLRPYLLSRWTPLVPENEYTACSRNAIQVLRRFGQKEEIGDYLEFGVSRGTSLACMYRALVSEGFASR